jgi:hypothetical protein
MLSSLRLFKGAEMRISFGLWYDRKVLIPFSGQKVKFSGVKVSVFDVKWPFAQTI